MLETFCMVYAELSDAPRAGRLLGAITALRESSELPIAAPDAAMLEAAISKVRDLPDTATWQDNLRIGSDYSLDDGLADALRDCR